MYQGFLTDVDGVNLGHYQDKKAATEDQNKDDASEAKEEEAEEVEEAKEEYEDDPQE